MKNSINPTDTIKKKYHSSIFLEDELSIIFDELSYKLVYIQCLDVLFAFSSIEFPTNDTPYIEFVGFPIDCYRDYKMLTGEEENVIKKLVKVKNKRYKFPNTFKWFVEEQEF